MILTVLPLQRYAITMLLINCKFNNVITLNAITVADVTKCKTNFTLLTNFVSWSGGLSLATVLGTY